MIDWPKPTFNFESIITPLRFVTFRRIWLASLLSNLGIPIQGVGAAWAMTQMTSSADKVALVQTALTLPGMLIAMPAGAIADMRDRRIVALMALSIAFCGASALTLIDRSGLTTPNVLLMLCFMVGIGTALMNPAWQSSIGEQVSLELLPAAVALTGISFNIGRSFGPAIGGLVVASAGSSAAFAVNALLCLPLMLALHLWKRVAKRSRLPREHLRRAIVSGMRYITNSPSIKIVLARAMATNVIGSAIAALMPLIARDLLHGGAQTYGLMFGAFGLGGVIGALCVGQARNRTIGEAAVRVCTLLMGGAISAVALSHDSFLTAAALVMAGAMWVMTNTVFNIAVQLSAPQWVAGRSLAAYQAANYGGFAVGAWGWGRLTDATNVEVALLISAALMLLSLLLGLRMRISHIGARGEDGEALADPEVRPDHQPQRAPDGGDRISCCVGKCACFSQFDAGHTAVAPAQRRLWLVDCTRHRRSRTVDGTLSLPDLARLPAPAQSPNTTRTCTRSESCGFPRRPKPCASAPYAGASIWISALTCPTGPRVNF